MIKYEIEFANLDKIINKDIDNFIISFFKNEQCIELLVNKQSFLQIRFSNIDNGYNIDCYINESKILSFNVNNKGSKKQISLTSGNITNNNINVLFSEIFDKNILEDYDKIEDKLSFNLDMLGFNLLEFELKNISNIYTNSNIDISNIDVDNLIDMDVDEVKNILKNFIYE